MQREKTESNGMKVCMLDKEQLNLTQQMIELKYYCGWHPHYLTPCKLLPKTLIIQNHSLGGKQESFIPRIASLVIGKVTVR